MLSKTIGPRKTCKYEIKVIQKCEIVEMNEDRVMPSSFLIRAQIRCHKDLNLKDS